MRIAASLFALLVLLSGTIPAAAVASGGSGPPPLDPTAATADAAPALVGPPVARIDEPAVTELHIAPDPGGNARWTVSVRYNLSSSEDRNAFADYSREFEAGEADVGLDPAFFRTLAGEASRATGREMAIRNVTRNATVQNGTGTLSLSFTWTNFVTDTDAGFVIQDAVLMPGNRTWLSSIGPSQRLIVETPTGYQVTDTRFGLDNGSVVVEGPHTFREPFTISYQQTATTTEEPEPQSTPWALIAGALLVGLALVAAVGYLRWRDGDRQPSGPGAPGDTGSEPPDDGAAGLDADADPDAAETSADADAAAEEGDEAPAPTPTDAGDATDTTQPSEEEAVDPALLSDEERVEHLLDQNGGRMKQARIVKETGWSDAKVSQLLSTMADDGRIKKLRLGRENLISLPDEEP